MAMPAGQPSEAPAEGQPQAGGASQLLADAHSNLLKLQELMGDKMPAESQKLGAIVQAIQGFAEEMGQPAGQAAPGAPGPATTSPEAGAANVKPAM